LYYKRYQPIFEKNASVLEYGLHCANVATRELALRGIGEEKAKADVRRYNKKCIYARKMSDILF
jgi:hypothetical protein